jgi:hypothetical protein
MVLIAILSRGLDKQKPCTIGIFMHIDWWQAARNFDWSNRSTPPLLSSFAQSWVEEKQACYRTGLARFTGRCHFYRAREQPPCLFLHRLALLVAQPQPAAHRPSQPPLLLFSFLLSGGGRSTSAQHSCETAPGSCLPWGQEGG